MFPGKPGRMVTLPQSHPNYPSTEISITLLHQNKHKYLCIATLYMPPGKNIPILEDLLQWFSTNVNKKTIILGDVYIDHLLANTDSANLSINLFNFIQVIYIIH